MTKNILWKQSDQTAIEIVIKMFKINVRIGTISQISIECPPQKFSTSFLELLPIAKNSLFPPLFSSFLHVLHEIEKRGKKVLQ